VRVLAFSDLHWDLNQAGQLVQRSTEADAVIAAGDFAKIHDGLEETIAALAGISVPTILVPGNNETEDELRNACQGWEAATVLHGEGTDVDGTQFFGLGAGVPITPWDWSFDLDEDQARERLAGCPEGAVLVVHSPPKGHCDQSGAGEHLGSEAILETIEAKQPKLAVCGHIHESWGAQSEVGSTPVINLGPGGRLIDV
jgi:Icc-related predicted phosphoesterase